MVLTTTTTGGKVVNYNVADGQGGLHYIQQNWQPKTGGCILAPMRGWPGVHLHGHLTSRSPGRVLCYTQQVI